MAHFLGHVERDTADYQRSFDAALDADDEREARISEIVETAGETLLAAIQTAKPSAPVTGAIRGKATGYTLAEVLSDVWDPALEAMLCTVLKTEGCKPLADLLATKWAEQVQMNAEDDGQ